MRVEFLESFEKDLDRIEKNRSLQEKVFKVISECEEARSLTEIPNVKKLKGFKSCYRIRVGSYRIGLRIENGIVTFVRFLGRKELYRFFP